MTPRKPKPPQPAQRMEEPPATWGQCRFCYGRISWDKQYRVISPTLGEPHDCATARDQQMRAMAYVAGQLDATMIMLEDGSRQWTWREPTQPAHAA
jgi:hypothetical protein